MQLGANLKKTNDIQCLSKATKTLSMCHFMDSTSFWSCTGVMNTIVSKDSPWIGIWMMVVESTIKHVNPKSVDGGRNQWKRPLPLIHLRGHVDLEHANIYNILCVWYLSKSKLIVDEFLVMFGKKYVNVQYVPSSSYRKVLAKESEKIARSVFPKTHRGPLLCPLSEGFIPHLKTQQNNNFHNELLVIDY